MIIEKRFNELYISTDDSKLDHRFIHNYLKRSYWTPGVSYAELLKKIKHSINFGVYIENEQIGYARIVTDFSVFGYLADVFIIEEHRGKGYSKRLMETILDYPDFKKLSRFFLKTKDAHGLYKQYGFKEISEPELLMER